MKKRLDAFSTISTEIFDKHALKESDIFHITISISLIMKFLFLIFLKNRSEENWKLFRKQRNKCVLLLQKSKNDCFENLNEKNITDKRFRQTVKPFLSKRIHLPERINITEEENHSLLANCKEVVKELNNFFENAEKNLKTLNIPIYENCDSLAENIDDPTLKTIAR